MYTQETRHCYTLYIHIYEKFFEYGNILTIINISKRGRVRKGKNFSQVISR